MEFTGFVKKVREVTDNSKEECVTKHQVLVENKDRGFKAILTKETEFLGISPGQSVTVKINQTQKTLDDFKPSKKLEKAAKRFVKSLPKGKKVVVEK